MDNFTIQLAAAALLGATVGLDPYIHGRKSALLTHTLAAVLGAVFVRRNGALGSAGLSIPSAILALLAALMLSCLWLDKKREEAPLILIATAITFGIACGAAEWGIAGAMWSLMLGLYIRRVSLVTETAPADRQNLNPLDAHTEPLAPFEWTSDLRWVREAGRIASPPSGRHWAL